MEKLKSGGRSGTIHSYEATLLTNTSFATDENPMQGLLIQNVLQGRIQRLKVVVREVRHAEKVLDLVSLRQSRQFK
jgi:hypothetical protein